MSLLLSDLFSNGGSTSGIPVVSNSVYFRKRNNGIFGASLNRRRQPQTLSSFVLAQSIDEDESENTDTLKNNSNMLVSQALGKKSSLEQLKRTVKQSLTILSKPKSVFFGSNSKSQSQQHQSLTHFATSSSSPASQHLLSKSTQLNSLKRPQSNHSVLDSVSQIIQSRKIGTADWLGLNERITQELASKNPLHYADPRVSSPNREQPRPPSQPARSTLQSRSNLNSSSLKERVQKFNNNVYTQIVTSSSISTPFDPEVSEQQAHPFIRQFSSCMDLKKPSTAAATSTASATRIPNQTRGSTPIIMSSLCMAQIKAIRGGNVKKADQLKFQHYYQSVPERALDFKSAFGSHSNNNNTSSSAVSSASNPYGVRPNLSTNSIDLNKIKYQPANPRQSQDDGSSIIEVRQMYLKNKANETQADFINRIIAEGQQSDVATAAVGSEEHKAQLKIDKYSREYKRKTFFVVNNNFGKNERAKTAAHSSAMDSDGCDDDEEEEFHNITNHKKRGKQNSMGGIPKEFLDQTEGETKQSSSADKPAIQKFKRVRKEICEFLRRHFFLGLSIEEAKKEGVFLREPFKREGAHVFFRFVKSNNLEMVKKMLEKDKYLVFDFDHTLQSPLHWAAKRGQLEVAQILLKNQADVNCTDGMGRTPLLYAYRHGHNQMGKLLLLNKASPWSTKRNPIDAVIHSRITNDMTTIKIAQQVIKYQVLYE